MSDRTRVPGQQAWMNVTLRVSVKILCRSANGTRRSFALWRLKPQVRTLLSSGSRL
jgi:hypothetical protein